MSDQVLVPIKKADGTVERISMAEFQARQKNKKVVPPPAPASKKKETEQVKIDNAVKEKFSATFMPLKQTAPARQNKPAEKIKIEPDLEALPEPQKGQPLISEKRHQEAEEIINKLNLKLSQDAKNRLIGLVQLRLKDVRGEEEIREWLTREESQYGIGLDAAAAERVIMAINNFQQKNSPELSGVPSLKKTAALMKEDREPFPATSSPVNPFIHAPAKTPCEQLDDLTRADAIHSGSDISDLVGKKKNPTVPRAIMTDITPAKPTNLGPVDEIRYMSLVDFRRLSAKSNEAADRLKQKFINLRDESYLLFMNAMEAWRHSPLFNDYVAAAAGALNQKKKISETAGEANMIRLDEVRALIQMEKDLL